MSDLEGMINSVLSNPDEMKKIMDMANSLMAGSGESAAADAPPPQKEASESAMPDISGLLSGASSLPPEMGAAAMKLLSGMGGAKKSEKHALLNAMKPYLSEGRRSKLDRAMQLAGVLNVGLGLFGKGGGLL